MLDFLPLPDNAIRQAIDSSTVFEEFRRAKDEAQKYAGGMYWKTQGHYEYLVRTFAGNQQKRMGPRSPKTEHEYEAFRFRKAELKSRLASLQGAVAEAERLNRALRVGRVPTIVLDVLRAIEKTGLSAHFTVVGVHVLFAYEAAAGVRIAQSAFAKAEPLRFWADVELLDASAFRTLQTDVNRKGFEVDFLRRPPSASPSKFEQVVVAKTGKMAMMSTLAPEAFIDLEGDHLYADVVRVLLERGLLLPR